tara:strand:+ start:15531 stop:15893 length:363 start_codon:yes stop_codon:yes gene_type:complete
MSTLEITLAIILLISISINVGIIMYCRGAITRLLAISEEVGDLKRMIDHFAEHITDVYNLDMFYGDETLQYLMQHAGELSEQLNSFEYLYSLIEEENDLDDNETEQTDSTDAPPPEEDTE